MAASSGIGKPLKANIFDGQVTKFTRLDSDITSDGLVEPEVHWTGVLDSL